MAGYWVCPRCEVEGQVLFDIVGPDALSLPLRPLTQEEAEKVTETLNEYVEDLEEA